MNLETRRGFVSGETPIANWGGEPGGREFDLLLHRSRIEIVNITPEQSELARKAWRIYGKGRHPAGLNLGDCCTYALSKYAGEPLLFKGNDFNQTNLPLISY
ncbi:MAG: type II toxin-antitoxin system VapC family toxin [Deltaproteobacteria bacterium]|nr:type II toxin-antitoxin system VapC family toxin [Deltaproteobacteria bacterium]